MTAKALSELAEAGVLAPLDVELARALGRIAGADGPVLLAAAFASRAVRYGCVCADLPALGRQLLDADGMAPAPCASALPPIDEWISALRRSPLVAEMNDTDIARRPLVLDERGRVYLFRYAQYQLRLAEDIASRVAHRESGAVGDDELRRYFQDDGQRRAARAALERRFAVISGGPGTGKTTTVVRILALLQERALASRGRPSEVLLLAPTGKAAQRLREATLAQLPALPCAPAVREALARAAEATATIHRALGYRPATPTRFRHDRSRPLPCDVVVVDEASMIDVALLAKLTDAVAPHARVVLLGDRDQLASVEAGAVLGDIYRADLGGAAVHLDRSYRYEGDSAVGRLARAVNAGEADAAVAALAEDGSLLPFDEAAPLAGPFGARVIEQLRAWFSLADPRARLNAIDRFRVLCAHRRGPAGAAAVNAAIERLLPRFGVRGDALHYDGRPILVTSNDYALGLFNGDVGVIGVAGGAASAYFAEGDAMRAVPAARLPPHETVFAMTVHKSQGSELDEVAVVLPSRPSPVLTRELVYTAVSRARRRVQLFGSEAVLRHALARRVDRASGLAELLAARLAGVVADGPARP